MSAQQAHVAYSAQRRAQTRLRETRLSAEAPRNWPSCARTRTERFPQKNSTLLTKIENNQSTLRGVLPICTIKTNPAISIWSSIRNSSNSGGFPVPFPRGTREFAVGALALQRHQHHVEPRVAHVGCSHAAFPWISARIAQGYTRSRHTARIFTWAFVGKTHTI